MARITLRDLLNCTSGAVAPTVALSLVGLIAVGGLAFDYSRLAGMHSELHNAADQAALAAASQLDGKADATKRAAEAAAGLVANKTLISNDGNAPGIGVASVAFYQNEDRTGPVTRDDASTTDDKLAKFVEVTVNGRQAFYALTPIVSLISSGNINAMAMAGFGTATCKVPPVMICNPLEGTDPDFTVANYIGKGLRLVSVGNGGGWAPGNFGYLNTNGGSNGAPGLREALGWITPPGDCSKQTGVNTKPGATVSVTDALNTRFDIYDSNVACPAGGSCPPSTNSVKDLVKTDGINGNACKLHSQGWQEVASGDQYRPTTTAPLTGSYPLAMGHPRDICHALPAGTAGRCDGPVGNGTWDIDAYFYVNYNHATHTAAGLAANATRYDVYKWEMAHAGTTAINGVTVLAPRPVSGALKSRGAPYCHTPGLAPGGNFPDRRRLSIAVVNCTANSVNGSSTNVPVQKWVDVFLVEPSYARSAEGGTQPGDIYVEVIAEAGSNGDGTFGQVVQRNVPYLVR